MVDDSEEGTERLGRMKILVCGGRNFGKFPGLYADPPVLERFHLEREYIYKVLYDICDEFDLWLPEDRHGNSLPDCEIISGEAEGTDTVATDWAAINWTDYKGFPADWDTHGKAAGPIRNQQMLDEGKPDIVLAFPGGRGTADMVRRAEKAGVEVRKFDGP